jgi:S-(hydroxymethyl)glutathione dehydrogenase/alcohol dehydrogenase
MKARAAVQDGNKNFAIEDIEVGDPGPGEVRIRIKASGVCHTDLKGVRVWPRRLVMGHEGAGVVIDVGPGVLNLAPGDRVMLNWAMPCGNCFNCRAGLRNLCENKPQVRPGTFTLRGEPIGASFGLGTMTSATVVPQQAITKIVDVDIPFTSACSVVVLGAGAVGICVIQAARIAGASAIVAVDVNSKKLEYARQFGATHGVLAERSDAELLQAAEQVKRLLGGRGADYAFECTSLPALVAAPLAMVRHGGTAIQVSGTEERVPVTMELFEWDKTYITPLYGRCLPERDFPKLLRHYQRKELQLDEMVTGVYRLEELSKAFDDMLAGKNPKNVIAFE